MCKLSHAKNSKNTELVQETMTIAVVIPSLISRHKMLSNALESVKNQLLKVDQVHVEFDMQRRGAGPTRTAAALRSTADWTTFLDDDDMFMSHHTEYLLRVANEHEADFVWGWFHVEGGTDPFPMNRGKQYKPDEPIIIPMPYMVRTELLQEAIRIVGGWHPDPDDTGNWFVQDASVVNAVWELGGKFYGDPNQTWIWRHHSSNTSGSPKRIK